MPAAPGAVIAQTVDGQSQLSLPTGVSAAMARISLSTITP